MVISLCRSPRQDKLAIAIRTLYLATLTHLQEDARMTKTAAFAVTGDAALLDNDYFGRWC